MRTNEAVVITGSLGTTGGVTCSKVLYWRDGSGNEYDASWTGETVRIETSDDNYEYAVCTATGGALTFATRGLDASTSKTSVASNIKSRRPGAIVKLVASASDIPDLDTNNTRGGTNTFNGNATFNNPVSITESFTPPVYADATARDVAIPTPTNGMIIYNTAVGLHQKYQAGAWIDDTLGGAVPNASTTVAGKIEQATTAQVTAGTATGETGAPLFSTPADTAGQIQSGSWVYGADAGGDDTYAVTLVPTPTAYTTGMRILLKVTTANTGACSLNVNSLGVKNIKTFNGNDPVTGDILAGQVLDLIYDGTNFVLQNEATTNSEYNILAGENITAGQALRPGITSGGETITQATGGGGTTANYRVGYDATNQYVGQSFTVATPGTLTQISLWLLKASSPAGNLTLKVYTDTGTTLIATSSNTIAESGLTGSATQKNFTFNYVLATGTYYYRLETSRANDATNYTIIDNAGSNAYAGGQPYHINSTNTRTGITNDHKFTITLSATGDTVGRVYLTDANFPLRTNCIGFARNTATAGNIVAVDTAYNNQQSGLTAGSTYYLSDTAGAISTSAGTNSKIVGKAISTTEIAINMFG